MTFFEYLTTRTDDVDVYVDGIDGIAFCPEAFQLTNAGEEKFRDCFNLEMDGDTVMGEEKDYDDLYEFDEENKGNGGRLQLAWEFLCAMAGFCSSKDFSKWFIEESLE